jgi:AcrR family transcriptional regulator
VAQSTHTPVVSTPPQDAPDAEPVSTRERILDVALDLFIEKGFDKTSLREIAEQLGVTKAALYYHFASKEDILMALHMRLHEFGFDALSRFAEQVPTAERWADLLDQVLDQMLAHRKIFLMHERNQAALETLHRDDHDAQHDDLQASFRRLLSDGRVAVRDRVRMAASFGAVMGAIFMSGDAFGEVSSSELSEILRDAVADLLR